MLVLVKGRFYNIAALKIINIMEKRFVVNLQWIRKYYTGSYSKSFPISIIHEATDLKFLKL